MRDDTNREPWTLDGDGSIVIPTRLEPGRLVGGALLALIGGAIGWQLVRGILISRASTHSAWSAYVPAVLVFGGFACAFLIPGAMMLAYRRSVRVDLARREVAERQLFLGYRRIRTYPLKAFRAIVLARRTVSRSGGGSRTGSSRRAKSYSIFVAELTPAKGTPLQIVTDQQEAPVRAVADKLRAVTGLTLKDWVERERVAERDGLDFEPDEDDE